MEYIEGVPNEGKRRFVVRMPEEGWFDEQPRHVAKDIKQTYVDIGQEGRLCVRQTTIGDDVSFASVETRGEGADRVEIEKDLTAEDAAEMLEHAIPWQTPVEKTRHVFLFAGHDLEFDVYPWDKKNCVVAEDLDTTYRKFTFPEGITVVGEVTHDPEFDDGYFATLDKDGPAGWLVGLYSAKHDDFLPVTLDDLKAARRATEAKNAGGTFVDEPESVKFIKEHLGAPVPQKDGWRNVTATVPMRGRSDAYAMPSRPYVGQMPKLDDDKVKAIREKLGLSEERMDSEHSAADVSADSAQQALKDSGYMGHVYKNPFLTPTLKETPSDGKSMIDVDFPTGSDLAGSDFSK